MLHVHLVFITKYHKNVFSARCLEELLGIFKKVCEDFACDLSEFKGEHDHVQLLVTYPPTVQLSKLVNSLKGVSSRLIRQGNHTGVTEALVSSKHLC